MLRLEVEWMDSGTFHSDGWENLADIVSKTKIGSVTTVGLLAHEDEHTLYLALSYDPDHQNWFGIQAIQKTNIIRRVILRARKQSV